MFHQSSKYFHDCIPFLIFFLFLLISFLSKSFSFTMFSTNIYFFVNSPFPDRTAFHLPYDEFICISAKTYISFILKQLRVICTFVSPEQTFLTFIFLLPLKLSKPTAQKFQRIKQKLF